MDVYVVMTLLNGYMRSSVPVVYRDKADAEAECRRATEELTHWGEPRYNNVWIEKWRLE